MDISLNWLKDFIDIDDKVERISDKLTFGGLEVEGIRNYESIPGGLKGIVIGEVLECEKHPNADRLSVTKVDIGEGELKPIVCGAPNVAKGQKVLVATVNATIHPTNGEAFKIKKAKIRGEVSEGMICAEDELGLGESHDGIMVLDTDLPNGSPALELFDNYSDQIIEIGLTPNRGDATGHLGVARDLKALYKKDLKNHIPSEWPKRGDDLDFSLEVLNPEACPRYSGVVINGIKVAESPQWLKDRLLAIGQKPINNIVDISNYIMHDLGQPLHAFDYHKLKGNGIVVKKGLSGKTFKTLDEVERKLDAEDLMICDMENPACIAGVFGGAESGVSDSTTAIFLESACFDAVHIRKSSQRHQLKTDAAFRYERGSDIDITIDAAKKAANMICEIAGGHLASDVFDIYPEERPNCIVDLRKRDVKRLIGIEIDAEEVKEILSNLDIQTIDESSDSWKLEIPRYRTEVTRPADVIEEILRIYGFNNIEVSEESSASFLAPKSSPDYQGFENRISAILVGKNCNEILTNSLTNSNYTDIDFNFGEGYGQADILNSLSEELAIMRDSMLTSSLEVIRHNVNRRQQNLRLFEHGFIYAKKDGKYSEKRKMSIALSGKSNEPTWMGAKENDFMELKSILFSIFQSCGISNISFEESSSKYLENGAYQINSGKTVLGYFGEVNAQIKSKFEIEQSIYYAELDIDSLISLSENGRLYKEISKFPEVKRDLSLVLDKGINYSEIEDIARKLGKELIRDIQLFDVFEGKPLEKGQKSYALTYILQDQNATLEDSRIDKLMKNLISEYEKKLNAIIRR